MAIYILEDRDTTKLEDIKDIPSVHNKFIKHESILYKLKQDHDKSFETLVVPRSLTLIILINSHSYQGLAGTN